MHLRWQWHRWPFALAAFFIAGGNASAHEKWFVKGYAAIQHGASVPFRVPSMFTFGTAIAAVILFLLLVWADRRLDGSPLSRWLDEWLARARLHPRTVLGTLIGVSLMAAGLQGTLFAPNLVLPANEWGWVLLVSEIALGTLFLFLEPLYAELGLLLAALYLAGFILLPAWDLAEELLMLGAGVFFMMNEATRVPWRAWNTPERRRIGYHVFRLLVGANFLILASVKWLQPELALNVVQTFELNFLSAFHVDDLSFVYLAALVETLIALCILLRVAFRPALAVAFVFFTVSIYFLGLRELPGHLPIKAALFLFFMYGHWHKGEKKT